jgi:hypothetical protein
LISNRSQKELVRFAVILSTVSLIAGITLGFAAIVVLLLLVL